jgi:glutamate 5-kinase
VQTCGQVLVTAESLATSSQYTLAKQTFTELLRLGAVPVVNENVRPRCRRGFRLLPVAS